MKIVEKNKQIVDRSLVLKTIRDSTEISRKELIALTKISSPTVTRIVSELENKNLVIDLGIGQSNGGRPPQILRFNENCALVIGLSWKLTEIDGLLTTLNGDIVAKYNKKLKIHSSFDEDMAILYESIDYLLEQAKLINIEVKGIGLGVGGYVRNNGVIEYSVVQKWSGIDLTSIIFEKYKLKVFVDSGSRVITVGEHLFGEAQGISNAIVVTNDYGLFSGMIINNQIVKGSEGFAGELGHCKTIIHNHKDRICLCGKTNCLAEFSAGRGILKTAIEMMREDSNLYKICDGDPSKLLYTDVLDLSDHGDELSINIIREAAIYFATLISNISIIMNPEIVVLTGDVCRNKVFFRTTKEFFDNNKLKKVNTNVEIKLASYLKHSGARGAASLVIEKILDLEI